MIKAKDVIGLKVITIKGGKEMAKVKDVVYDPKAQMVKAFILAPSGMFSSSRLILISDIHTIGEDAVTIESEELIKKKSQVENEVKTIASKKQYLTKTKIVTEDGKEMGHVVDIYFDPTTGKVDEFEVSEGILGDVKSGRKKIKVSDIITVGEDATVVRPQVKEEMEQQAKQGGAQKVVEEAKEKAPQVLQKVKDTASKVTQKVQQKAEQIKESPQVQSMQNKVSENAKKIKESPQVQKVQSSVKEGANKLKENVASKADEVKESEMPAPKLPEQGEAVLIRKTDEMYIPAEPLPSKRKDEQTLGSVPRKNKSTNSSE